MKIRWGVYLFFVFTLLISIFFLLESVGGKTFFKFTFFPVDSSEVMNLAHCHKHKNNENRICQNTELSI